MFCPINLLHGYLLLYRCHVRCQTFGYPYTWFSWYDDKNIWISLTYLFIYPPPFLLEWFFHFFMIYPQWHSKRFFMLSSNLEPEAKSDRIFWVSRLPWVLEKESPRFRIERYRFWLPSRIVGEQQRGIQQLHGIHPPLPANQILPRQVRDLNIGKEFQKTHKPPKQRIPLLDSFSLGANWWVWGS